MQNKYFIQILLILTFIVVPFINNSFAQTDWEEYYDCLNDDEPEFCGGGTGSGGGTGGGGGSVGGDGTTPYDWDTFWDESQTDDEFPIIDPGNSFDCAFLRSSTVVLEPYNRRRRTFGIGEEFGVFLVGGCQGDTPVWSIKNDSTECVMIDSANAKQKTFSAGFKPGKITITVDYTGIEPAFDNEGCNLRCTQKKISLEFTVIEPTGIFFEYQVARPGCYGLAHTKNKPSINYRADLFLQPDSVNFYKIRTKESAAPADTSGLYFQTYHPDSIPDHIEGPWIKSNYRVFPSKGTYAGFDDISYVLMCNNPIQDASLSGKITYNIKNYYERMIGNTSTAIEFSTSIQSGINAGGPNSRFTAEKNNYSKAVPPKIIGSITKYTNLQDPNNCSSTICP